MAKTGTAIDSSAARRDGSRGDGLAEASKRRVTRKKAAPKTVAPKVYTASIYADEAIPKPIVDVVQGLERELKMPVWLAVHDLTGKRSGLGEFNLGHTQEFYRQRQDLPQGRPVAILVHSPGGYADSAYQLAKLLRRQCGSFTVVVPRYAKSAATLFVLGADQVYLGGCAELGPLDVQYDDMDREERTSALDEVQALQRLHAAALSALDETMFMLANRTKKKADKLLPHALQFATEFMRPLLENIDPVHYTQRSRSLKVAEEYATRLLTKKYGKDRAEVIARALVEAYPEHGFVIDDEEANDIGFKTETPPPSMQQFLDQFTDTIEDRIIIGRLVEVKT